MLNKEMKYSYNDITIVPSIKSHIEHRSDCDPFFLDLGMDKLPIFTAPMSTVVNEKNFELFENNGITPILPRNCPLNVRIDYLQRGKWVALGLKEFEELFVDNDWDMQRYNHINVLIDIANGHMSKLHDIIYFAKSKYKWSRHFKIMAGNIANPHTYYELAKSGADYIRLGIGSGNGCFVDGTKITTKDNGKQNIEDVKVGDMVLTHDGTYQYVLDKLRYKSPAGKLCINGEITCTQNHHFFVINKSDVDKVNENNLDDFAFWVKAKYLMKEQHYLIKRTNVPLWKKIITHPVKLFNNFISFIGSCFGFGNKSIKQSTHKLEFVEINNLEVINNEVMVNDLTVETNHNYIANDYIVHNCITTSNTSIHYPMASLIEETYKIKKQIEQSGEYAPMIVADGGIRNYSDVIKALGLGANCVMIGSVFASLVESAAPTFYYGSDGVSVYDIDPFTDTITQLGNGLFQVNDGEEILNNLHKVFYGMASKRGQEDINGEKTKTSEGIQKILPVTTNLNKWVENMIAYLRSAMSYTNCFYVYDFNPENVECLIISSETKQSINK